MEKNQSDFDLKGAIKEVADANDGIALDSKLVSSILRSVPVQTEIKKLIWISVKEKIVWFAIALIALLGSNFLAGAAQSLGSNMTNKAQHQEVTTSTLGTQ